MRITVLALISVLASPALAANLFFLAPNAVDPIRLLSPPPANRSFQAAEELKTLHQIHADATPAENAVALADSKDLSVFLFAPVLGANFTPAQFPATAALFKEVFGDGMMVGMPAKDFWHRPRPYMTDPTLVPVCGPVGRMGFSYPSGHSTAAWMQATVLAALLPAKADAIRARASAYAFEREVCGVHYPSDVEAGHVLGVTIGRAILASPAFQKASIAARQELAAIQ